MARMNREGRTIMEPVVNSVELDDEPIGIIISRGSRDEATPRFSAYVWGPGPDEPELETLLAGVAAA